MKTIILALSLLIGGVSFAQLTPGEKAINLTKKMTTQLSLNDSQVDKISQINQGIAQKNQNIRTATNMTADQQKEILASNYSARMNMYANVLTEEQLAIFNESEKVRLAANESDEL